MAHDRNGVERWGDDGSRGYAVPWAPVAGRPWEPGVEAGDADLTPYHRPHKRRSWWRLRPELAHQIMTAPVRCVGPDDRLGVVADIMSQENVGIVPVIDDDRRVLGVVTDRDIVIRAFGRTRRERELRVGDVMTRNIWVAAPDEPLELLMQKMRNRGVQRVPVVDERERLLGIISLDDLVARTDERQPHVGQTIADISERRRRSHSAYRGDELETTRGEPLRAADVMVSPALAVDLNASVSEVVSLMRQERIGIVPVVDRADRLRGVLTDRDVLLRVMGPEDPRLRHERLRAREVMTVDVEAAGPGEPVHLLLDRMGRRGVHRIPIVDRDDRLIGIVSMEDIAVHAENDDQLRETLERITRHRSFWHRLGRVGWMP